MKIYPLLPFYVWGVGLKEDKRCGAALNMDIVIPVYDTVVLG
jgi:hypothetical protein